MIKISTLCVAASLFAWLVPACDADSSSNPSSNAGVGADGGEGNYDGLGESGEGGAAGGHATDAMTECERLSNVQCKQFYRCLSTASLAEISNIGSTEADCVTSFPQAQCADTTCPSGKTYMPGNADACVSGFARLSCDELVAIANNSAADPAGCDTICE
jgi:hypothetical protein